MGLGDDLLFLGESERIHKQTGKKYYEKSIGKWCI